MSKLFSTLILVVAVLSSAAHAQSDSGLIPNNTVLGNTSGVRGSARPIPMPAGGGSGIYDVKTYGALCDGVTNDYSAIMAAITAAKAAGGGTVMFPGGKCVTTQMIDISGAPDGYTRITLKGQGQWTSWLVGTGPSFSGACLVRYGGQGLIEDMSFNNGSRVGITGVSMHGVCNDTSYPGGDNNQLVIRNSLFYGFGRANTDACIYNTGSGSGTSNTHAYNNTLYGCSYGYQSNWWNVGAIIEGNRIFNVMVGIRIDATGSATEGLQIIYNEIIAGSERQSAPTTSYRPLDITNACYDCHIVGNIFDAWPVGGANYCETVGMTRAIRIQNSATTTFQNNWIAKGFLATGTYNIGLRVVGNTIPDGCLAYFENASGFVFANNYLYGGTGAAGQQLSINNSNNFVVNSNVGMGNRAGMAVSGTVSRCIFSSNIVSSTSAYGACTNSANVGP